MTGARFDEFVDAVQSLWPAYKVTREHLNVAAWSRLHRWSLTEINNAMQAHLRENPDANRPHWKTIIASLYPTQATDVNEWQDELNVLRRVAAKVKAPYHEQWSDAEVWDWHLRNLSRTITWDAIRERPHEDPDGRRAFLASQRRECENRRWAQWHREHDLTPPECLEYDSHESKEESAESQVQDQRLLPGVEAYVEREVP